MAPKIKTRKAKATTKVVMPNVLSFRVTDAQQAALKKIFERDEIIGVRSLRQFARKIVCDFTAGKLKYANEADRLADTTSY